jgi:hypothetical protein
MMHPGHVNPDTAGPAGPKDPDLTVLSVRDRDGRPLAVLGNFSMHYYGAADLSSDFTGRVCEILEERLGVEEEGGSPFVALMSQGTSGDLHYMDYALPARDQPFKGKPDGFERYSQGLAAKALEAIDGVTHRSDITLAMAETKLRLGRRLPDAERLAWAKEVDARIKDLPKNRPEVLAREAFWIRDNPSEELKLQAIRIGDLGVTAMPNEVYGITGLKIKMQSPLRPTMNIELANGAAGYIPPPEQHHLGGYTTWPARTAGLEVQAEPKIADTVLGLLERVSGQARRAPVEAVGGHGREILRLRPAAWWRMSLHSGDVVADASGHRRDARLEPGYALFLPGPEGEAFASTERGNRAVHFAGGRMVGEIFGQEGAPGDYTVSCWFWNAMPVEDRAVTGYLFSMGVDGEAEGDHLGISGSEQGKAGRLMFDNGPVRREIMIGSTELKLHRWYHVLLVRREGKVSVFLDGHAQPEFIGSVTDTRPRDSRVFVGGRSDGRYNFEGKIDEVALFGRALDGDEKRGLASGARSNRKD